MSKADLRIFASEILKYFLKYFKAEQEQPNEQNKCKSIKKDNLLKL